MSVFNEMHRINIMVYHLNLLTKYVYIESVKIFKNKCPKLYRTSGRYSTCTVQ